MPRADEPDRAVAKVRRLLAERGARDDPDLAQMLLTAVHGVKCTLKEVVSASALDVSHVLKMTVTKNEI